MIKRAKAEDTDILAALATQMWTEHNSEEMTEEFRELLKRDEAACLSNMKMRSQSNHMLQEGYLDYGKYSYQRSRN